MEKVPLTNWHRQLFDKPTISSQFPVTFKSGSHFESFTGYCNECECEIPDDLFRGAVNQMVEHTVIIDAVGLCIPCRLLTTFSHRIHDDMSITCIKDGKWVRYQPELTFLEKIKTYIGQLFK